MSVHTFYNPQLVEKLRRVGIGVGARQPQLSPGPVGSRPQDALGLVEECARLRAQVAQLQGDVRRLTEENTRLREGASSSGLPSPEELPQDDAALRFRWLELDR